MIISPFIKKSISTIIAPHGITDLIHARQNELLPQLYSINTASVLGSTVLDHDVMDKLFFLISAWHFRKDMPKIRYIPNFVLSSSMLFLLMKMNPIFFIIYMLAFHVPNHYIMNLKMLNENPKNSIIIICLFSTVSAILGDTDLVNNPVTNDIAKGLIFSHIIYEELYVHRNHTEPIKFEPIKFEPIKFD